MVGFCGADLADPDHTESSFAPAAADFDGLAGSGQEAYAIETGSILAEIHGVGTLNKTMALGIGSLNDHTERFGNARLFAGSFPKVRDGLFEGQADSHFVVGGGCQVRDADFLLRTAAFMDEEGGIANVQLGLEGDERAAGIDDNGLGFFVEGAALFCKTVNHDGDPERQPLAGAEDFLCGDRGRWGWRPRWCSC